ncbi:MAG: Rpn family recombination-promoting nuclease/putative transposase [Lachnospiraceae bacterium]|nr:Rpn family recombination-promoting nuclease/putative transposase [Lachnospiraceae bacterium]
MISLIEHKSKVDYNVVMQIFRYMSFIWEDYEREMEKK